MENKLDIKLKKYFELTSKALKKVKIAENCDKKKAGDILDLAQRYYDDAKFFEKKNDVVNAFGAVCYAHAFLDIGARLGYFDVGNDSTLFMVD